MLKITNFSFSFPNKELYNNVSFSIEPGQRCAFIGASGTGKSTLATMIVDPEKHLYDGKIELDEGYHIGYVTQFYQAEAGDMTTVFDYIAKEFVETQTQIEEVCEQMAVAEDLDAVMEQYQQLLDQFEAIDGDHYESNIQRLLNLANLFERKDVPVSSISGGEFKLIQVMKQMLTRPHFIIMDEPDAFLDFDNIKALKELINSYKGTMLVITHSRYLLNHCFNKLIHLENKEIQEFDGCFVDYNYERLETKIELQELSFLDTQEIERNEALIERLRTIATNVDDERNGRALNARVKINERLQQRRIKAPFICMNEPVISLETSKPLTEETVLTVQDFGMSFDELLLEQVSFALKGGEKVAIIGANGTGKTTLLRALYQNQHPTIQFHPDVEMAYLSQVQGEMLQEDQSIYNEFFDAGFPTYESIENHLANYEFREEQLHQIIKALSGGEKNMIQLAKIANGDANLLLLDEPTSHLDTYAQIALEKAINQYNGSILMVSHDFYFIANCMDYVLLIEDKTVRKMSIRKFRKNIYANHFDKDYLALDQKKKLIETRIEQALLKHDFTRAKEICAELQQILQEMQGK